MNPSGRSNKSDPQLGTTEIWRFINDGNTMHPMHMHLVFFNVLDRTPIGGGAPIPPDPYEIGWKDTAKANPNQITRVIAKFTDYAGPFAYHCHILEHEDHEMMRQFRTVLAIDLEMPSPTSLVWSASPGASAYDTVRGDLGTLRSSGGEFAAATEQCLGQVSGTSTTTAGEPPLATGEGHWYLIRQVDPGGASTYDSGSSAQVDLRDAGIAASGVDCP